MLATLSATSAADIHTPEDEQPYEHTEYFITTLRISKIKDGPLVWPVEALQLNKALAAAAHTHMPTRKDVDC